MIVAQEQAITAGVALGVNSISSGEYLDEMDRKAKRPLLNDQTGRVQNVLVVDGTGNIQDSLRREFGPTENSDKSKSYVRLKDISLPPQKSAVELNEAHSLPEGLSSEAQQLQPGDPGAFYFPVETTNGRWYVVVVLSSANTLTSLLATSGVSLSSLHPHAIGRNHPRYGGFCLAFHPADKGSLRGGEPSGDRQLRRQGSHRS